MQRSRPPHCKSLCSVFDSVYAMLDRGAVVSAVVIEPREALPLLCCEPLQRWLCELMKDVSLPCKPSIHQYHLSIRQQRTVRLDEGSGVEDGSIVIVSAVRTSVPDDEAEGVCTDEIVLCVEILVCAVILTLLSVGHPNLAVCAVQHTYRLFARGEESVE